MANIDINLGVRSIRRKVDGVSTYTFKDIGTSNMKLLYQMKGHQQIISLYDKNTSNNDEFAIKASLNNLFSFLPGQQILQPQFGNTIYNFIYQPINQMTKTNIIKQIKKMVNQYQPRIQLTDIKINANIDEMAYNIQIFYNIPKLNKSDIITVNMSSENINII